MIALPEGSALIVSETVELAEVVYRRRHGIHVASAKSIRRLLGEIGSGEAQVL